jgi:hypothetical protein
MKERDSEENTIQAPINQAKALLNNLLRKTPDEQRDLITDIPDARLAVLEEVTKIELRKKINENTIPPEQKSAGKQDTVENEVPIKERILKNISELSELIRAEQAVAPQQTGENTIESIALSNSSITRDEVSSDTVIQAVNLTTDYATQTLPVPQQNRQTTEPYGRYHGDKPIRKPIQPSGVYSEPDAAAEKKQEERFKHATNVKNSRNNQNGRS